MPLEILLISQNLQLASQLEKLLDSFNITTRVSFDPLDHLLQQVSGVVWDLNTTSLPTNSSELQILRNQITGPILLLDQNTEPIDTICSYFLNYHLDDYIQSSSLKEIVARTVQKIWVYQNKDRLQINQQGQTNPNLKVGHLKINLDKIQVNSGNVRLNLSPIEYKLLLFFVSHSNTVLSRTQIASAVWGNTTGATLRIIDTHISNLRKKIETEPKNPQMLKTIRGFGYLFKYENQGAKISGKN
ncbi:response regulator transcription factor [Lentilactobacillus diolivorans]|uniref:response regulator transcription factor n=1 Tax=Lentilactobacillus diolivorans TaxID=179838 RepID=UPI002469BE94|nr:response regulator transcription factor [Lentilactobacillus diolivorans]MDH5104884.1 response regulator transcription factor [Lentilactobacillus diolivorans]